MLLHVKKKYILPLHSTTALQQCTQLLHCSTVLQYCTDRRTDRQTDRQTDRHTDRHTYINAVLLVWRKSARLGKIILFGGQTKEKFCSPDLEGRGNLENHCVQPIKQQNKQPPKYRDLISWTWKPDEIWNLFMRTTFYFSILYNHKYSLKA